MSTKNPDLDAKLAEEAKATIAAFDLFIKDEQIQAVPVDIVPAFTPELKLIVNENLVHDHFGKWIYDKDTNVMTAEVSPQIKTIKINYEIIGLYLARNMPVSDDLEEFVLDYTVDVENCATCSHFAPSAGMVENGAEQIINWPYNKAKKEPQCSNADLVGKGNFDRCDFYPNFNGCSGYSPNEWSSVLAAYVDDQQTMVIDRRFYGTRKPKYRIGENNYDTLADAMSVFETHVQELREAGSTVSVVDLSAPNRNHLFNTILV
jgi:hypothetical protein